MTPAKRVDSRRYFKELRMQQLRALLALERYESFAAAAATLDLSTPTVWQQIRALEAEFQVELVTVQGKKVRLTNDARILIDSARPLVEGFDSLSDVFAQRKATFVPKLKLTSTLQLLKFDLAEPLREFRRTHSHVQLSIIDQSSRAAREYLRDGKADLAIVGEMRSKTESALNATRLMDYPFVFMAPKMHPQLHSKSLSLRAIAKEPLVLSNRETAPESRVRKAFRKAGVERDLNVVVDAVDIELLIEFVASGYGVCVASMSPLLLQAARSQHQERMGFRDVSQQFGVEPIVLLSRAGRFEQTHHREFQELLHRYLK